MKMLKRISLLSLIILALVSSCVVPSLYPLYTRKDLITNSQLEGLWVGNESENERSTWKIWKSAPNENNPEKSNNDKRYYLEHIQHGETVIFELFLLKLGDKLYLDFFPVDFASYKFENYMGATHIFPVHTFAKVELENGQISIYGFDGEFLEDLIEQNRIKISHEEPSGSLLLTASPEELQKFVLKYSDDKNAFADEPLILKPKV
ncbi:hypothetical protein IFO69_09260 [Echinicola sp. CAU 1574]|uniref:Lipoprotein n=1 Tax=Echinicola arenosa TaxID=2774144 RepID=A0ABR9AKS7_9BACT|nr:hypothetical protein [Echinicola arenosa]MBD8488931.1 hypothetical protein [Echinicola arenosa]